MTENDRLRHDEVLDILRANCGEHQPVTTIEDQIHRYDIAVEELRCRDLGADVKGKGMLSLIADTEDTDENAMSYHDYLGLCAEHCIKPLPSHSWQQWCEVIGITTRG